MPVLPLVGSTMCVSGWMCPSRSPASIIAAPIRSFTLLSGWKNSHLAKTVAWPSGTSRLILIIGVSPIAMAALSYVRLRGMTEISGKWESGSVIERAATCVPEAIRALDASQGRSQTAPLASV